MYEFRSYSYSKLKDKKYWVKGYQLNIIPASQKAQPESFQKAKGPGEMHEYNKIGIPISL